MAATVRSSADGNVASPPRADAAGVPKQAAHLFLRGNHEGLARLRPLFGPQDVSQVCKSIAATKPPKQPWHWASRPWHWAAQAVKHPSKQRRKAEAEPIRRPKRKAEPEPHGANRNPLWCRCALLRCAAAQPRAAAQREIEFARERKRTIAYHSYCSIAAAAACARARGWRLHVLSRITTMVTL